MSTGRCSGCGKTGAERDIVFHVCGCPQFAELYQEYPDRVHYPTVEYQRWQKDERPGQKAAEREAKVADTEARRGEMARRFRTRDLLEDE